MSNDANDFEDFRAQRKKCHCACLWESDALLLNEINAIINRSKVTPAGSSSYGEEASKFAFMKLPLELRVMIYQQHFLQSRDAFTGSKSCAAGTMCPYGIYNANIPVGELLLVSKTIYNEAMPIYFGTKDLKFLGRLSYGSISRENWAYPAKIYYPHLYCRSRSSSPQFACW